MKYVPFYIIMLLTVTQACGQDKPYVYYFDKNLSVTQKDSAVFTGMGWNDGDKIKLRCFNVGAKTLVFMAYFKDTTLKIFDGLFQSYYPNGDVEMEGNYANGRLDGLWMKWDLFRNVTDSSIYRDGAKILSASFTYHPNQNFERKMVNDLQHGQLYNTYYNVAGNVLYKDSMSTRPGTDSLFLTPEIEADFPGGQEAWMQYLNNIAKKNRRALRKDNKSGTCNVRFQVDKEGRISNIKVVTMEGTALCKVLLDALSNGPAWKPATQQGRAVKSIKEVPLTYSVEENDPLRDWY